VAVFQFPDEIVFGVNNAKIRPVICCLFWFKNGDIESCTLGLVNLNETRLGTEAVMERWSVLLVGLKEVIFCMLTVAAG
jgi:hypothetical protein